MNEPAIRMLRLYDVLVFVVLKVFLKIAFLYFSRCENKVKLDSVVDLKARESIVIFRS